MQLGDICVIGLLDLFDEFRRPVGDVQLFFEFFFQREFIKKRGKDLAFEDLGHFRAFMQILPQAAHAFACHDRRQEIHATSDLAVGFHVAHLAQDLCPKEWRILVTPERDRDIRHRGADAGRHCGPAQIQRIGVVQNRLPASVACFFQEFGQKAHRASDGHKEVQVVFGEQRFHGHQALFCFGI